MCFSVNVNLVRDEIEDRYGVTFPDRDRYQPSYYYHAFGLPELPALCSESPEKVQLLRWGLIPSWVRNSDDANIIRYKTFNARAETVETKPSFSASLKSGRCVIPVKGFFEWQHKGNEKIPWYIYHSDYEIFSIAGLYARWVESSTGEVFNTFSIITTDANDLMAVVHNSKKRMPAILDKSDEKRWINQATTPAEALTILRPCPSEVLKAHTISKLVNDRSANRNNPEVIRHFYWATK
ncbi:MAG TPA: SOS response-associated peptidase [Bacteroidales bacterium]|nr:SOS response-associated peptidase [Bacteroidales bacterium]